MKWLNHKFFKPMSITVAGVTVATAVLAATPVITTSNTNSENFKQGIDYTVVSSPATPEKAGMIEVREFFWYGCSHCFKLEPFVAAWHKTKPADVNFVLTPASMNKVWEQNARGFYAVQLMGLDDKTHGAMFNLIHGQQATLTDQASYIKLFSQPSIAKLYSTLGVDTTKFNSLYNSFAVSGKIAQANKLANQFGLDGVPALIVNGKYVVKGENARSLKVVDYLIAKERKLMPKSKRAA